MKTVLARTLLLTGVSIFPALAGNQVLLRNLNSADGTPTVLAAGGSGRLFVISTLPTTGAQISRVVELDLTGARLASLDLAQMEYPAAAVTDGQGDLIVVGQDPAYQAVVLKIDPQLHGAVTLTSLPARINAVTADASGNIYLTGIVSSASFPVTAGAYQTTPPVAGNFGSAAYAFVSEISPAGKMVYSTYFGSDGTYCVGGSFCVGKFGVTTGTAIALDASGDVVIAGTTTASGLPTTAGALAPTCVCGYSYSYGTGISAGFVARFQPGATEQLQWSTFLNAAFSPIPLTVNGIALDSAGNVIVGGSAGNGLPVTAGAFQFTPGSNPNGGAFLLKLNNAGTAAIWGTYFGTQDSAVQAVYVDAQQRVVFSGYVGNPAVAELQYKPTFVARVTSDGATLTDYYQGPDTYYLVGPALANTSTGGFASVVQTGALWIETAAPGPSLLNIANSASGQYANSWAPLELVTLYGVGIGPQTALGGQVQNGVFTSSLGGYQVLFNGVAAPLLYAGSGQIDTIVPGGVGASTQVQVVTPAGTIDGPAVPLSSSQVPGIFQNSQSGLAAALNQDGSVNSPSNPAGSGSIVTVFVTANSGTYFPDGAVVPMGIYDAAVSVWVLDSYRSLEVVFAGAAPGMVAGVMQINFRLPNPLPAGSTFPFSVEIGGVSTATAQSQIAIAP